jgi:penicillin-binding protein 1B
VAARTRPPELRASYFVDTVRDELSRRPPAPGGAEVRVDTTLDPALQRAAEAAIASGLTAIERAQRLAPGSLQGALVAIEPGSGRIRALVGGRRYRESPFNRATQAHRQPGSLFKPFVYLAAFETRRNAGLTPASLIADEPFALPTPSGPWSPRNYDGRFQGQVTIRRALEQSLNVPAVRLAGSIGVYQVARVARAAGIDSRLRPVPSLALGSSEVTLLEITGAYATLASGGLRVPPTTIDPDLVPGGGPRPVQVVTRESAFLITHLLRGVMRQGTGASSARWGLHDVTAGKTGTTNDLKDAWFVGYTRELVIGVWVGRDDAQPLGLTGSQAALPIWATVMQQAIRRTPPTPFAVPDDIVLVAVERDTGRRASPACGGQAVIVEAFVAGSEPPASCPEAPAEQRADPRADPRQIQS